MNSREVFFYPDRHLKIDNTTLEPDDVARRIAAHFALPLSEGATRSRPQTGVIVVS